jgi:antitoxin (DNA-binding transcriptional repressor) of toxin-antitoxin stability system
VVTPRELGDSFSGAVRYGEAYMKSVGIREAKARISELARAAANGDVTVLTDYGKPIAMIAPIEQATTEERASDAREFREALLSLPYHLDVGF